jgi:hypothetical protein
VPAAPPFHGVHEGNKGHGSKRQDVNAAKLGGTNLQIYKGCFLWRDNSTGTVAIRVTECDPVTDDHHFEYPEMWSRPGNSSAAVAFESTGSEDRAIRPLFSS